jgi:tetratricopeptide (TPR) repeat protein
MALAPKYALPFAVRGLIFAGRGDPGRAVDEFTHALRLDPEFAAIYRDRGLLHVSTGAYAKGLDDLNEAIRREPKDAAAWNGRGMVRLKRKEFEQALVELNRAAELDCLFSLPYSNRGEVYAEQDQWGKAAAQFAAAVQLAPEVSDSRYRYGLALLASGDRPGYRAACTEMQRRFGRTQSPGVAYKTAWVGVLVPGAVDDMQPCVRLAEQAAAANPGNYGHACTLGAALYRAGRFEEAERKLSEANKLHGRGGTPYDSLLLALTHARLGHAAEARQWLDKAIERMDRPVRDKPGEGTTGESWDWETRLAFQLLRHEAEDLLNGMRPGP